MILFVWLFVNSLNVKPCFVMISCFNKRFPKLPMKLSVFHKQAFLYWKMIHAHNFRSPTTFLRFFLTKICFIKTGWTKEFGLLSTWLTQMVLFCFEKQMQFGIHFNRIFWSSQSHQKIFTIFLSYIFFNSSAMFAFTESKCK